MRVKVAGAVGGGAQVDRVADQLDLRDLGADQGAVLADLVGAEHAAAAGGQVAHDAADVVVGHDQVDLVDRLEQGHRRLARRRLTESQGAGGLEGHVGGVDAVRLAVAQGDPDVDDRVAGRHAPWSIWARTPFSTRGDELARHRAADDLVDELEARALRERLDLDVAHGVLPVPAGLLDVPSMALAPARRRSPAAAPGHRPGPPATP